MLRHVPAAFGRCWKGANCSAASRPSALQQSLTHSCLDELNFTPHFRNICLLEGLQQHSYGPWSTTQKSSLSPSRMVWISATSSENVSQGCKTYRHIFVLYSWRGAREGKGFLLLFPWAAPRQQDLVTLKVHLPNYSISLFSYTWERHFFMFHQTSKWREGWEGWSASLSSRAMEPLTHKLCYSCREEKLWATLAETLAVHHCLQLEFLLRAFTNDNLGQE